MTYIYYIHHSNSWLAPAPEQQLVLAAYNGIGETAADGEGVDVVEVGVAGRRGVAQSRAADSDTMLDGPIVTLFAPLDDDTILVVNSTRLDIDETEEIASMMVVGDEGVTLPTPAGYTERSTAATCSVVSGRQPGEAIGSLGHLEPENEKSPRS
ncbi:MAG: hypothetical protein AB8G14_18035, partial [Ilumatobacter sp.]